MKTLTRTELARHVRLACEKVLENGVVGVTSYNDEEPSIYILSAREYRRLREAAMKAPEDARKF